MAEYNVRINVKTSTGYDQLYPKTKSDIIDFDNSNSDLKSNNAEEAIKELNTKIGILSSLSTDDKEDIVSAINEVDTNANKANNTANTNKSNIGILSSLKTSIKNTIVNAINSLYDNTIGKTLKTLDEVNLATKEGFYADALAVKELNSKKEPTQKRTTFNSIYYKNGYDCHMHCASDDAEDVIVTLPTAYRPRSAATVSGFCLNENSNGFYPCIASILADGTWAYVSALNEFGQAPPYYIYNQSQSIDRRSYFKLWLGGSWSTNTNGA